MSSTLAIAKAVVFLYLSFFNATISNMFARKDKINTIIVSDVHLGSIISRAEALTELLSSLEFERLIILGDLFDSGYFKRLDQSHWKLLSLIQKLSDPASTCEIIWVRGNHDKKMANTMAHMVGARLVDEYAFNIADRKLLAIHGDRFVRSLLFNDFVASIGQHLFYFLQYFDKNSRHIVKLFDRSHSYLRRLSSKVAYGAIKYAKERDAQYIFCGHTHKQMYKEHIDSGKTVHYYNTGCWTQAPSSYITISKEGEVSLLSVE